MNNSMPMQPPRPWAGGNGPNWHAGNDLKPRQLFPNLLASGDVSALGKGQGQLPSRQSSDSSVASSKSSPGVDLADSKLANLLGAPMGFDYSELVSSGHVIGATNGTVMAPPLSSADPMAHQQSPLTPSMGSPPARSRSWHEFGRQTEADKVQIPKMFSNYGFKYFFESPISTSQRREDDRITYINKGQFYGVTMEYIPDPDVPPKFQTVRSVIVLVFREEKTPEDEIKCWTFWHGRQHNSKQRILDVDTKNSIGILNMGVREVAHNAVSFYWNPLDGPAKVNIAVQCLSTDFSTQKGVKGLPLHVQIDTYEDPASNVVSHRGYCQIKIFCDKGAERKTRDEERKANKKKLLAGAGRKKVEDLGHPPCERSEFYTMRDSAKAPVLFTPSEDVEESASMEFQTFYGLPASNAEDVTMKREHSELSNGAEMSMVDGMLDVAGAPTHLSHHVQVHQVQVQPTAMALAGPPSKRAKLTPSPTSDRLMLYVRQDGDEAYTPLHLYPPSLVGLLNAIQDKFLLPASAVKSVFRKNQKGIKAKIDDDMLRYFCNEDTFMIRIERVDDGYQVLLTVDDAAESNVGSNDRPRSSLSSKSTASVPFLSQRSDDSTSSDH